MDMRRPLADVRSMTVPIDLTGLRVAGGAMLALGATLPLLPHNPGLPCPLRTLTGIPCPLCGMTTSVKAALAGHVVSSVAANPFGVIAVLVAVALLLRPRLRVVRLPVAILVTCALVSWTWELRRFGIV